MAWKEVESLVHIHLLSAKKSQAWIIHKSENPHINNQKFTIL
jgi:hypothetical protein